MRGLPLAPYETRAYLRGRISTLRSLGLDEHLARNVVASEVGARRDRIDALLDGAEA